MKLLDLSLQQARDQFGDRLVTLNSGKAGLRGGLRCEAKEVPGDDPVMDFIASDATLDRYNEVIEPAGWLLDNFRANPVIPDCHDYSSIARILGRADAIEVKDGRLVDRVRFCLDNPLGLVAYKMAKGGFIKSQSVGFIPVEWKNAESKDGPSRTYLKAELLEISLVVVPANPGATIGLAYRSGVIERAEMTALADYLKEFCSDPKAGSPAQAGASGAGTHDAQLLQIARGIHEVLCV